jgi:hypothetical protein
MPGPSAAMCVLDLTEVVSGPFETMFLADQGGRNQGGKCVLLPFGRGNDDVADQTNSKVIRG